ncbi:MAG: hypothetical protein QNJ22_09005 [Desulfosarcinaceae bacterium]|nr:hypothetical protein [Desulfosarcinaceae bacterium]
MEQKQRVLIEMRVPKSLSDADAIAYARRQIQLADFELDAGYPPVPSAPIADIAAELDNAGEHLLTLRGTLPVARRSELEKQPGVVSVWSDAEVAPFDAP